MKASFLISSATVATLTAIATATEAEASRAASLGSVNVNSLHVRSGPSTDYSILGSLPHGTFVQINGQTGSWYQIQYENKQAYVHSEYISSVSDTGYTVNASALNIRTEPNVQSSIIGVLSNGQAVPVTAEQNGWYVISLNGQQGYIKKDYVSSSLASTPKATVLNATVLNVTDYYVTASALRVRSGPGTAHNIVDVIQLGQQVQVLEKTNDWYKVRYSGKEGFVSASYVSPSQSSTGATNTSHLKSEAYYVTASALRVRSGPGTAHDIIDFMQNGQQVQVLEKKNDWYKVRYAGKEGFVSALYVASSQTGTTPSQTAALFQRPAEGSITSTFGMRWGAMHPGIDIAAAGVVKVHAAAAGTVTKSYYSSSYGNVIFITHKLDGQTYTTVYAHLESRAVQAGATVSQGQFLGNMGNTGHSTGQHLHFELHKGEWNLQKTNAVNPLLFLQS